MKLNWILVETYIHESYVSSINMNVGTKIKIKIIIKNNTNNNDNKNNNNNQNNNNNDYNNDNKTKGYRVIPEALKQLRDLLITTLVLPPNKKKIV